MGKGIQDIGNGLGYIYITDPSGNIQYTYENTPDNARQVKLDGVKAAALGGNRSSTSIVGIDTPTGVGSITAITVDSVNLIDTSLPIAYTGATTDAALAQLIVDGINSYETGGDISFTAVRIASQVYILSTTTSKATNNGQTPVLVNTGSFTYTVDQDFEGGSSTNESWDEAIGYNFYLDADYGTTQCSGGGVAVPSSIANAVNITSFIVNIGLQSSIPIMEVTLSKNNIVANRKGAITNISLTGEGAANDDLENIVIEGASNGDLLILGSGINTIAIKNATGNIVLQSSSYNIIGSSVIMLVYVASNGKWEEVCRSVMEVADNGVTTGKILDLNVTTAKIDDLAVTTGKIALLAINDTLLAVNSVITSKILDSNVTVAKVETTLKTDLILAPISWDTNRKGDHKVVIPFPCTVNQIDVFGDDLIEATDDADANFKNNAGLSMGSVTFSGGDTIGTGYSVTPTANNTFTAGQILTITTTKTTAGGNAKASIKVTKS